MIRRWLCSGMLLLGLLIAAGGCTRRPSTSELRAWDVELRRLGSVLFVATLASLPAHPNRPTTEPLVHEPRITYIDPPTAAARETIAWAVDYQQGAVTGAAKTVLAFVRAVRGGS